MTTTDERMDKAFDTTNNVKAEDRAPTGKPGKESLLDMEKEDAAKQMLKEWDESRKHVRRFMEQWKVNKARSAGYVGVALIKRQDTNVAYIPKNARKNAAGMNKAARLRRRLRAALFADPPAPEAVPSGDADDHRDAAEFATRVLVDTCAEGQLAYTLNAGDAFDLAGDYGSGFIRLWVDPYGGGWRAKEAEMPTQGASPILRYVTESGEPTDNKSEAAKVWMPRLCEKVLTGKQVRLVPFDCDDIWDATGCMVGDAITLGELKSIFPDIAEWSEERLAKLVEFRPQHFKELLPGGQKDHPSQTVTDDAWVFVLTYYKKQSIDYPMGAYLIAAGENELLDRRSWFDEEHGDPLDIPITQFKHFTEEGTPYGDGVMSALGPGNELRAMLLGSQLEHLERFKNRLWFVPMTSTIQPGQLLSPTGSIIPVLPGGEPKAEVLPDFPPIVEKMLGFVSHDMDEESGLQAPNAGVGPSGSAKGVNSARHQELLMQQIQAGISDLKQNTERGLIRGWRIMLQLIRAFYSVEQRINWVGDDGRYKEQSWTNADLGTTKDVRLMKGSFTGLPPLAKAEVAQQYAQMGVLQGPDLQHVIEGNIGGVFGLQDNPHRMRVRRQIALWHDGPPKDFVPPMLPPPAPPMPPQPGQPPQAPPPPPNPFAPLLAKIFDQRPNDDEPQVAQVRLYELGRTLASTKFTKWPPAWQAGLVQSYQQARQSAQVMDAKQIMLMKKKLQQQDQKLKQANVSVALKGAELDEAQTVAILMQEGIQLPPRQGPAPTPERGRTPEQDIQVELAKHKMSVETELQKKRIDVAAKLQGEEAGRQHQTRMMPYLAQIAGKPAVPVGK